MPGSTCTDCSSSPTNCSSGWGRCFTHRLITYTVSALSCHLILLWIHRHRRFRIMFFVWRFVYHYISIRAGEIETGPIFPLASYSCSQYTSVSTMVIIKLFSSRFPSEVWSCDKVHLPHTASFIRHSQLSPSGTPHEATNPHFGNTY